MKEWLIRTKSNHILGPVSREKLRELIANNSIKGDDEVCCGNGYWVFVREKELITKYIFEEKEQSFNPVQEAEFVKLDAFPPEVAQAQMPDEQDLEYPANEEENPSVQGNEDKSQVIKKKKNDKEIIKASGNKRSQAKPEKIIKTKQSFYISPWVLIAIFFVVLIIVSTIFKENIMKTIISNIYSNMSSDAYAQTLSSPKKKSGLIIHF